MATNIYLGYPPENIKQWIIENHKPTTKLTDPLCFTAINSDPDSESSIRLIALDDDSWEECPSWCSFIYSTDEMKTWNDYPDGETIYLSDCENKTVYIKAKYNDNDEENPNAAGLTDYIYYNESEDPWYSVSKFHKFIMEGEIKASGNIQFLLDNTGSRTDVTPMCYYQLFYECYSLIQAPKLQATTLAYGCYGFMFYNCTSLTQAPELPATTLADNCYEDMFSSCTSLTQAPELPAITLAKNCYINMFGSCASLTQAPELPATTLVEDCYYSMFNNCSSPIVFSDKTFDEIANLIEEHCLIGGRWYYYDEEQNEITINPVEIICSDKTMLAMFNEDEWTWTITEK